MQSNVCVSVHDDRIEGRGTTRGRLLTLLPLLVGGSLPRSHSSAMSWAYLEIRPGVRSQGASAVGR